MAKFRFFQDKEVKTWVRDYFTVEADTLEEAIKIIEDEIDWNFEDIPRCEAFATNIADYIVAEVNWETIGVAVERVDFDEEWANYQIKI